MIKLNGGPASSLLRASISSFNLQQYLKDDRHEEPEDYNILAGRKNYESFKVGSNFFFRLRKEGVDLD